MRPILSYYSYGGERGRGSRGTIRTGYTAGKLNTIADDKEKQTKSLTSIGAIKWNPIFPSIFRVRLLVQWPIDIVWGGERGSRGS